MEMEDFDERYVDEFGKPLPIWKPIDPEHRGRHDSFSSAAMAAFKDLTTERSPFFDSLVDNWNRLLPNLPAKPGRFEDGKIFLYVKNSPTLFAMRPRLGTIQKALSALPNAPKKIELRLEIRK